MNVNQVSNQRNSWISTLKPQDSNEDATAPPYAQNWNASSHSQQGINFTNGKPVIDGYKPDNSLFNKPLIDSYQPEVDFLNKPIINDYKPTFRTSDRPIYNNITEMLLQLQLNATGVEIDLADPALTDQHADQVDAGTHDYSYQDIDGEIIVDGVEFTDIKQGAVGDCYLMAAISSIALNNPAYLEQMITDNNDGTYTVHFAGGLGDVTIDDDFVVDGNGNALYAKTGDEDNPELYVAIIEKTYAKGMGGFDSIEGGWANNAIAQITGQNSFTIAHPSQFTPEQIQEALANNQSVTATSLTRWSC